VCHVASFYTFSRHDSTRSCDTAVSTH
jgi:hypothetical protein